MWRISLRPFLAALVFLTSACAADARPIVVSSKADTEGALLGGMMVLALQAAGFEVSDRTELGGTPIVRAAILAGEIDLYPEYTGNAASFFHRESEPTWKDAAAAYEAARRLDGESNGLVWLKPAPADNGWGIAVRNDVAKANGLATLSDFGRWVTQGGALTLAASTEFVHSASALPSFERAYGFHMRSDQLISLAGGDTAATLAAAAKAISGANAAMVYGTDGGLPFSGLVMLDDDRRAQAVYQPAPVIRRVALEAEPRIADVIEPIFATLDLETMRRLNGRIQVGGEPARAVAEAYLREKGLVR
jgi:osmoprotectant transport system substrate-binding protein